MNDLTTQRLRAAWDAVTQGQQVDSTLPTAMVAYGDIARALAAADAVLAGAVGEARVEAAVPLLIEATRDSCHHDQLYDDEAKRGLLAVLPVLLAKERALIAGLSQALGEAEADLAALRAENERCWQMIDTHRVKLAALETSNATLRQRLAEMTEALRDLVDERPCVMHAAGRYCLTHSEKVGNLGCPHAIAMAALAATGTTDGGT